MQGGSQRRAPHNNFFILMFFQEKLADRLAPPFELASPPSAEMFENFQFSENLLSVNIEKGRKGMVAATRYEHLKITMISQIRK